LAIGFADTQDRCVVRRVGGGEKSGLKELGNNRFESSEGRRWERYWETLIYVVGSLREMITGF
jgi:hypothetical protein